MLHSSSSRKAKLKSRHSQNTDKIIVTCFLCICIQPININQFHAHKQFTENNKWFLSFVNESTNACKKMQEIKEMFSSFIADTTFIAITENNQRKLLLKMK